jgi:replicative DNA helicase
MNTQSPYFKTKDLKIPPQNIEAEKALLGSVMMRGEVMHDIADIVGEHSFYSTQHKTIWATLFELHSRQHRSICFHYLRASRKKDLSSNAAG